MKTLWAAETPRAPLPSWKTELWHAVFSYASKAASWEVKVRKERGELTHDGSSHERDVGRIVGKCLGSYDWDLDGAADADA